MAIQFARCEYVSRSGGGNACRKASYNQREVVRCERTGELFSYKERAGNAHHEILLPEGAHEKFKNSSVLWNEVEACERRINSQLAKEFVLALPDDNQVTLEDRIELTRCFGKLFVEKGIAVQLDVHSPHNGEKNWHAHLLITTRRFSEDGLTFGAKARDLDPVIRGGKVVEANLWGEVWRELQNDYFEEKGYDVRVDPIGIVPQEHLGPVRMRHHLNEAVLRAELLQKANEKISQRPSAVLEELTRTRAVFTQKDVNLFLRKHIPENERESLLERLLDHPDIIPLYHKEAQEKSGYFTTKNVRSEEEKLLRFADTIAGKSRFVLPTRAIEKGLEGRTLSQEQKKAYDLCVNSGQNLSIIQGRAGVGKSYVLGAIREAHEADGFRVLGLAPTHKVAMDLKNDGFQEAKTCHSFLFALKNNREKLDSNTLVIVDEAGMLGTTLSVELFNAVKNSGAKLILVGDDRQLSSVERGGTFRFLSERYGALQLTNVRRQSVEWQKAVSESLAERDIKMAVHLLQTHKAIAWNNTKEESLAELLKAWGKDNLLKPNESRLILAQKNIDVDALNQGVRDILRAQGRLGEAEILCSTQRGRIAFAEGDRVQFTTTNISQDLTNASFGVIDCIDLKTKKMTIRLDNEAIKEVNPDTYDGLRHGYASTIYKAQGATLDHVYVLHSRTTNQSTNYVALTRQAKSLHLYVSHDETPSPEALIHQMGRLDGNGTSLVFDTLQDIGKNQEQKTFTTQLKHGAETLFTKVTDAFHRNEKFYQFEKSSNINPEKAELVISPSQGIVAPKDLRTMGTNVFEALIQQCTQKLYAYLGEEKISLTSDLKKRIENQSEKAAGFIFYAHTLKGTRPTEKEVTNFLLRAKYELDRIPEIRQDLIHKWQKAGKYQGEKDELIAHMIAERQASIESRMYLEAKQRGLKLSPSIPEMAARELKAHRALTNTLSQELAAKHGLSESAATLCAKDILRYQETHGEKPSTGQVAAMVQISRELDQQSYSPIGSHNIEYIRRRDGDSMFREMSVQGKDLSGFREFPHKEQNYGYAQAIEKSHSEKARERSIEENSKSYQMDLSM